MHSGIEKGPTSFIDVTNLITVTNANRGCIVEDYSMNSSEISVWFIFYEARELRVLRVENQTKNIKNLIIKKNSFF